MKEKHFRKLTESVEEGGRILRGETAPSRIFRPSGRPPTHPGAILLHDFLEPIGMTRTALASRLGVSPGRIHDIVNGKRRLTADTALRLARFFRTTPEFWLNGQRNWDLWQANRRLPAGELSAIEPLGEEEVHLLLGSRRNAERLQSALRRSRGEDPDDP